MTVAHDHGYCCLQTKAVPGAAFEGASDGGVVGSTRTDHNAKQGGIRQKQGESGKLFFFCQIFFYLHIFFGKSLSIWVLLKASS
jgi:hypothetical protein